MSTKKSVEEAIKRLNKRFDLNLNLDYMSSSGYRVQNNERFLSPRLPIKDMYRWLDGFEEGIEVSREMTL